MKNNPNIPNELYYLDEYFSSKRLNKYQLKEILNSNNIPHRPSASKVELAELFETRIRSRRKEILEDYKLKELLKKEEEAKEVLGRGHRTPQKRFKIESDIFESTSRPLKSTKTEKPKTATRSTTKKDKDGFAIPTVPKKKKPTFTAEDSFGEEEDSRVSDFHGNTNSIKMEPKLPSVETTATKRRINKKPSNSIPSFNPEDSFASSDDIINTKKQVKKRTVQKRASKIIKKEDFSLEGNTTTLRDVSKQLPIVEPSFEEYDDLDYEADSDISEDDDESDVKKVTRTELALLQKEQHVPIESLTEPHFNSLDNNTVIWNNILTNSSLVYIAVTIIVIIIYLCASEEQSLSQ